MLLALAMTTLLQPEGVRPDCGGNTLEMNACFSQRLNRAQKRLDEYLEAALKRHGENEDSGDALNLGIQASQRAFEAYRAIECGTVYEDWKAGTIRGMMHIGCQVRLTDDRTHTIWRNWLQYMDSTPPVRPEPAPTE